MPTAEDYWRGVAASHQRRAAACHTRVVEFGKRAYYRRAVLLLLQLDADVYYARAREAMRLAERWRIVNNAGTVNQPGNPDD